MTQGGAPAVFFMRCYNAAMSDLKKPSTADRWVSVIAALHHAGWGISLMVGACFAPPTFALPLAIVGAIISWCATSEIVKAINPTTVPAADAKG
jgi:hypothetical protein